MTNGRRGQGQRGWWGERGWGRGAAGGWEREKERWGRRDSGGDGGMEAGQGAEGMQRQKEDQGEGRGRSRT